MHTIYDYDEMAPEQIREEVARILATGLRRYAVRLVRAPGIRPEHRVPAALSFEKRLDFPAPRSINAQAG